MSILVKNLTKQYGTQKAVSGISFSVRSGEIVGFIGPNGAGKSTTMKVLTGFIQNYTGEVAIAGLDLRKHLLEIQSKTGYLPEHNPLYLEMYVKEYLQFVGGVYKVPDLKTRVDEMIQKLGLTNEFRKPIQALSKGYRQRVGLASALIHDPEILILDEPTTGLDPNQIVEIRNLIAEIGENKTILLSTHIMQEVEAICDRVLIIDKGSIIADGRSDSVKEAGNQQRETIIVEFERAINLHELKHFEDIIDISDVGDNRILIETPQGVDLRKDIFAWAVAQNNAVLTMQKQEKSLETVFRELTRK